MSSMLVNNNQSFNLKGLLSFCGHIILYWGEKIMRTCDLISNEIISQKIFINV